MLRHSVCLLLVSAALGCNPRTPTSLKTPQAEKPDPRDTMPATQRVRGAVPILHRTLTQNDLNQLLNYLNQYHASHNRYPKTLDELTELGVPRDAPHIAKAIESGEFVLAGGAGGVLGYEQAALEDRGSVITTNGVQVMTADELKQKLGQS